MDATLTTSDDAYHLDWNGNSLADEPVLVVNGETGKQWSIFDILLAIIRKSPQSFNLARISSVELKHSLMVAYLSWRGTSPGIHYPDDFMLNGQALEFQLDPTVEGFEIGDIWGSKCFVRNIKV